MLNTIWSTKLQNIKVLDYSRKLRFRDDRKYLFLQIFGLKSASKILDIGCGPGTLTRKLSRWLGQNVSVTGVDRDSNFIKYARQKASDLGYENLEYFEANALNLPFKNETFDTCISTSVIEHIPNKEFINEQYRVCKKGGNIVIVYFRPDKYIKTPKNPEFMKSKKEIELFEKLIYNLPDYDKKYMVGKYWPKDEELPQLFNSIGLKNVKIDAIAIPEAIDDSRNTFEQKLNIIQNNLEIEINTIDMLQADSENLSKNEIKELKSLINKRYMKRSSFLEKNQNIWDFQISLMQIVSGEK